MSSVSPRPIRALVALVSVCAVAVSACANNAASQPAPTDDAPATEKQAAPEYFVKKLGGETSAREFRGRPFNQSSRSLTNEEFRRFGAGAVPFDADFTVEQGLGTSFNDTSCLGCHIDEPQGEDHGDEPGPGLLVRLSVPGQDFHGAPIMEPTYGLQLQTEATTGEPEGSLEVEWTAVLGQYPDGTSYELRKPKIVIDDLSGGPLAADAMTSLRVAPPLLGLGLLEAIPHGDLAERVDEQDDDNDGISGRFNTVWDATLEQKVPGFFGWKASQPTVRQQSAVALHDDMGMTSSDVLDPCAGQGSLCERTDSSTWAPEMNDVDFDDMIFYNRTIAVPLARNTDDPDAIAGAWTFDEVGCSACHTPTHVTGDDEVPGLSNITFHPFTDLLLHDMGAGLADGRNDFDASGTEWRTAPLWGFGRRAETTEYSTFLHDGRARNAEEAVLWHGGEAAAVVDAFKELPVARREQLITFVESL